MKANKAPEKIYVPTAGDELHYHMTCPNNDFQESIEYVRKDAFIEKACEWLSKHFYDECYQFYDNDGMWIDADSMLEDFKTYMKGE